MPEAAPATVEQYTAGNDLQFDGVVTRDGAAVDITVMTVRFRAIDIASGEARLSNEAPLSNVVASITDGPSGQYRLTIAAAATDALDGQTLEFAVNIEDSGGKRFTVKRGYWHFLKNLVPVS